MMGLQKRVCVEYVDGAIDCFRDDGFWSSQKGQIIKWSILGGFFLLFMLWLVGGYLHARQRLKQGKPLLAYHRFLVAYPGRYQVPPQNQYSYYANPNPYQNGGQNGSAQGWGAPPVYSGDAPPMYGGVVKTNEGGVEMGSVQGAQQNGVVGSVGGEGQGQSLPPRPARTKAALRGFTERFKK